MSARACNTLLGGSILLALGVGTYFTFDAHAVDYSAGDSGADGKINCGGDLLVIDGTVDHTIDCDAAPSYRSAGTLNIITVGDLTITPSGDDTNFIDTEGDGDVVIHTAEDGAQGINIHAGQVSLTRDNNGYAAIKGVNGVQPTDEFFVGENQPVSCADSGGAGVSACGGILTIVDSLLTLTCLDADGCTPTDINAENPTHLNSILYIRCTPTTGSCILGPNAGGIDGGAGACTLNTYSDVGAYLWDGTNYTMISCTDN